MTSAVIKKVKNGIFYIFQIFSLIFMTIVDFLYRPTVEKPDNLVVQPGTLILSNHQTYLDPWIVTHHLGLKNIFQIIPVRYPVSASVFRKPFMGLIISLFGGFDIGLTPIEKAKKLLYIRSLIYQGYTVLLFPEGKRVRTENDRAEFQRGMNILIAEKFPLVLVKLSGMNTSSIFKFRKNKIGLRYSRVIQDMPPEEKIIMIENFFHQQ